MGDREALDALEPIEHTLLKQDIDGYYAECLASIRQALEQKRVPKGWKLVPITPTPDMRDAWEGHYDGREPEQADHDEFVIRYAEMLSAAPAPETNDG